MSFFSECLRIGCWNVNSLRVRWPLIERWLVQENIHIALFQETKLTNEVFPEKKWNAMGYHCVFFGQKSYNGVAIVSRWPLYDVQCHDFNDTGQARYIQAITQGIRLASVYVPQGQNVDTPAYAQKIIFLHRLCDHIQTYIMDDFPTIIAGDYNIAPKDEDIWDPELWENKIMCSLAERQAFRRILYSGWHQAHITHKGQSNAHTWWPYQNGAWPKKHGLCIDSFLLSSYAADICIKTGVSSHWRNEPQTSDHAPIWMDIHWGMGNMDNDVSNRL